MTQPQLVPHLPVAWPATKTVKKLGVLSVGKVLGCLYAILGLIGGIVIAVVSMIGAAAGGQDSALPGVIFGVGAIIFAPLIYGVMGFVAGIILAALYNLVVGIVGGIELELD